MRRALSASINAIKISDAIPFLRRLHPFANSLPEKVVQGFDKVPIDDKWSNVLMAATTSTVAFWPNRRLQISHTPRSNLVVFGIPDAFSTIDEALAILEPLPFEVCGLGSVFFDEWIKADFERWSFSRSHIDHGWACAFRGAGHDRLVSRRWLDFGPWRVIRRPNDTTFIQFHDLAITGPTEAYEQAKIGHERMGCSDTGGFIQQIEDWMLADVRGLYFAEDRKLEVIVPAHEAVSQSRMANACTLRLHHRLTRPAHQLIERVAFVFFDEADARAHLHELWLRELECWHVDGSGKHRLDLDYHPTPNPPEWVKRLEVTGPAFQ
jgi:hypothetical protein